MNTENLEKFEKAWKQAKEMRDGHTVCITTDLIAVSAYTYDVHMEMEYFTFVHLYDAPKPDVHHYILTLDLTEDVDISVNEHGCIHIQRKVKR